MVRAGYYAVAKGKKPGIYKTWPECEAQVKGFPGATYKKFSDEAAASDFYKLYSQPKQSTAAAQSVAGVDDDDDDDDDDEQPRSTKRIRRDAHPTPGAPSSSRSKLPISVYCDGAATSNGKVGAAAGWGVWFADEGPLSELNESKRLPGKVQTNNRAELMAIIRAIQLAPSDEELVIHSDSQYSIQAMTAWQHGWRKNAWKRSNGEDVQNRDLIRRLEREMRGRKVRPVLKYVKGHAGHHGNEMADRLAVHGASLPQVPASEWEDLEPSASEDEGAGSKTRRIATQPSSFVAETRDDGQSTERAGSSTGPHLKSVTTLAGGFSVPRRFNDQASTQGAPASRHSLSHLSQMLDASQKQADQGRATRPESVLTSLKGGSQLDTTQGFKSMPAPPPPASIAPALDSFEYPELSDESFLEAADLTEAEALATASMGAEATSDETLSHHAPTSASSKAASPPPRPTPPPTTPIKPMLSGLPSLDQTMWGSSTVGLPAGAALEIIGPTASGKTKLGLQMVVKCRVESVLASADAASEEEDDHDQILILDTEGSITEEMIEQATRSHLAERDDEDTVDRVLHGIYLVRASSLAELMAFMHLLTTQSSSKSTSRSPLPLLRNLAAIFIDSISYHLRHPLESHSERSARRTVLTLVNMTLHPQLQRLNPRTRLLVTNQMTLKMYTPQGELVNYKVPGSIARLVPQIDGPNATGRAWNGVEGDMDDEGHTAVDGGGTDGKGSGVLGEAAQRILLFRDGTSRYVRVIWKGKHHSEADEEERTGAKRSARKSISNGADDRQWVPFAIDEAKASIVESR